MIANDRNPVLSKCIRMLRIEADAQTCCNILVKKLTRSKLEQLVEDIIQRDVEVYVTEVVREKRGREREAGNAVSTNEWREDSRLLP